MTFQFSNMALSILGSVWWIFLLWAFYLLVRKTLKSHERALTVKIFTVCTLIVFGTAAWSAARNNGPRITVNSLPPPAAERVVVDPAPPFIEVKSRSTVFSDRLKEEKVP